jgi:ferritin-like metal-binding protein YciE
MATESLRDLYINELRDLFSAEQQILDALPEMAGAAASDGLKRAFQDHLEQTRVQRERLELIFKQLNEQPGGKQCEGIAGLIREGREHLQSAASPDVRDAALIASAQRVEHYEMAAYGTARTYAGLLGDWESERLLQQTLDEEGDTDHRLTRLAQSGINQAAASDRDTLFNERWSRLRFIDADDLEKQPLDYSSITVRSPAGDELGTLDGFVADGATGRPFYYVVDSGGWFMGRRYLVPIGRGRLDASSRSLQVGFDKDALRRLPEFSTSAFMAMSDDQMQSYERRVLSAVNPDAGQAPRYWEAYDTLVEYRQPEWLPSSTWRRGYERTSPAADRSRQNVPAGTTATGRTSDVENTDFVTAKREDERTRDPRLNTLGEGVRGVSEGEPGPHRLDDEDLPR